MRRVIDTVFGDCRAYRAKSPALPDTLKHKELEPVRGAKGSNDLDLWRRVAATVRSYPGRRVIIGPSGKARAARGELTFKAALEKTDHKATPPAAPVRGAHQPAPNFRLPADIWKKLADERLELDMHIDLHRLSEAQAYNRLRIGLAAAQGRSMRHVLVITGKGKSPGSTGLLHRLTPYWLTQPELAGYVAGYRAAAARHGGNGALYVRLKTR